VTGDAAIKLILDQGVPREAAAQLRDLGYQCVHIGEIGKSTAEDEEILEMAAAQQATIVTLDADFHMILAVSGRSSPSAIRLRIEGQRAEAVVELVVKVIQACGTELQQGALVTVKARKTTCHILPIGRSD
jgi:predicted nuclease of predicted toxin-antitoxin system